MNFISGRSSSNLAAASFEVSKVIAQHGKPLCDGDYVNSFAPAKIAKKNVRKVAVRKTVIINHNYVPQVCL